MGAVFFISFFSEVGTWAMSRKGKGKKGGRGAKQSYARGSPRDLTVHHCRGGGCCAGPWDPGWSRQVMKAQWPLGGEGWRRGPESGESSRGQ